MPSRLNTVQYHAGRLVVKGSDGRAIPAAELTDCSVAFDATDKTLPNENQVPILAIRGELKCSIKAKVQRVLSAALRAAVLGGTITTGAKQPVDKESVTIAAGSGTVSAGATFSEDLGVLDNAGNPMEPVASAPTLGQYIAGVAGTGTYTFNAAEVSPVGVSYIKTTATGEVITVDNQVQGQSPTLSGWFWASEKQVDGVTKVVADYFYKLVPSKLSAAHKRGDFADSDLELMALANAAGKFCESHNS